MGLSMAVFLVIAGLTGSLLVFYDDLDAALNPHLYRAHPPSENTPLLDPLVIRERLLATYPTIDINWITLKPSTEHALRIRVSPRQTSGKTVSPPLVFNEIFVNPYTGEVQGTRTWGRITDGLENLLPFLYKLHYQLALGQFGTLLMGIIALLWTIDCFAGIYLTFPGKSRPSPCRQTPKTSVPITWLKRWRKAWRIRWKSRGYAFNFDLHVASGLWLWLLLFVLAWSSVAFNLGIVYYPVMNMAFDFQDPRQFVTDSQLETRHQARLSYAEIRDIALTHLHSHPAAPVTHIEPTGMSYIKRYRAYQYRFRSDRDVHEHWGRTRLYIDAYSGAILGMNIPTGETSGDTVSTWIKTLHMAGVWGLPYKILLSITGGMVALLSITGVIMWWRKRSRRVQHC